MNDGQEITTYFQISTNRERGIEILYGRYGRKLYNYAVNSWHLDEDDAWERVYETLYKLMEKFDEYTFPNEKKFSSFLFTIFCNNLRRLYRDRKKREERLSMTYFNESSFEESRNNPEMGTERKIQERLTEESMSSYREDDAGENVLMTCLEECLDQLQDWERILILLRAQDMPYSEIGKYMNKPVEQLKVYHQRARKKLQQMVEEKSAGSVKQEIQ